MIAIENSPSTTERAISFLRKGSGTKYNPLKAIQKNYEERKKKQVPQTSREET